MSEVQTEQRGLRPGQSHVGQTLYTDRDGILDQVCVQLAEGIDLTTICKAPGMPSHETIYRWANSCEETAKRIARARDFGFDAIAKDAIAIVDGSIPDLTGGPPDATRDKARADVRLKLLAKWDPKRYGDSVQLKHADADGKKLDTGPLVAELLGMLGGGVVLPPEPDKPDLE